MTPAKEAAPVSVGSNVEEVTMAKAVEQYPEWVDGFLFVGNHPSLDLLNTRLVNADGPVELLPDLGSLQRWFAASGLVSQAGKGASTAIWSDPRAAQAFVREVVVFREQLRAAVLRLETGKMPQSFLNELNGKLATYPRRYKLKSEYRRIEQTPLLQFEKPQDLWSEIANAAAHLLTEVPWDRVRKCEGCVVYFYDVSKKGSRRWCTMSLCGNREKVATYRHKQRELSGMR